MKYYQLINHKGLQNRFFKIQYAKRLWETFPYLIYAEVENKTKKQLIIGKEKFIEGYAKKMKMKCNYTVDVMNMSLLKEKIRAEKRLEYKEAKSHIHSFYNFIGGNHCVIESYNYTTEKHEEINTDMEKPSVGEPFQNKINTEHKEKQTIDEPFQNKINTEHTEKNLKEDLPKSQETEIEVSPKEKADIKPQETSMKEKPTENRKTALQQKLSTELNKASATKNRKINLEAREPPMPQDTDHKITKDKPQDNNHKNTMKEPPQPQNTKEKFKPKEPPLINVKPIFNEQHNAANEILHKKSKIVKRSPRDHSYIKKKPIGSPTYM